MSCPCGGRCECNGGYAGRKRGTAHRALLLIARATSAAKHQSAAMASSSSSSSRIVGTIGAAIDCAGRVQLRIDGRKYVAGDRESSIERCICCCCFDRICCCCCCILLSLPKRCYDRVERSLVLPVITLITASWRDTLLAQRTLKPWSDYQSSDVIMGRRYAYDAALDLQRKPHFKLLLLLLLLLLAGCVDARVPSTKLLERGLVSVRRRKQPTVDRQQRAALLNVTEEAIQRGVHFKARIEPHNASVFSESVGDDLRFECVAAAAPSLAATAVGMSARDVGKVPKLHTP